MKIHWTCRILAFLALVPPAVVTAVDSSAGPSVYSTTPGLAVGDWETCGRFSTSGCFALPAISPLSQTVRLDERPILASNDFSLTAMDGSPTAPAAATVAGAETDTNTLAKQVNNPIANLISVPVENDWDMGIGPAHATRYLANIEPVIPFSLNDDWNLITRTIVPVIDHQALSNSPYAPASLRRNQSGLGDILQSFFFSPKDAVDGWIIGAGPVGYYPTATNSTLGAGKWGTGPAAVGLRQEYGFTYGLLATQIWSVGGQQGRPNFSTMLLQPFFVYTAKSATSLSIDAESSRDWYDNQWLVPINAQIKQVLKIGKLPVQFAAGYRYYVVRPTGDPNWGLRFTITLLFPRKPS